MGERRRQILRAAEALIRRDGTTDFSMKELALEAGFSLATSYNLIGTKSTVLYSLLNSSVEDLTDLVAHDLGTVPSEDSLLGIIGLATRRFTDDPDFYQPLIRFLEGVPDPVNRPLFMQNALEFWRFVSEGFEQSCPGRSARPVAKTGLLMHMFFLGGLNLWAHQEISGDDFGRSVRSAAVLTYRLPLES